MHIIQTNLILSLLLAILVADHPVDPIDSLGPRLAPVATQETIKAARDKADLEMKLNTKRPWDGMDLTGPHAFEERESPVEN